MEDVAKGQGDLELAAVDFPQRKSSVLDAKPEVLILPPDCYCLGGDARPLWERRTMPLRFCVETEDGEVIDRVTDHDVILPSLLPPHFDVAYCHLSAVDYYGITMFNYLQIPRLVFELRSIRPKLSLAIEPSKLEGALQFLDAIERLAAQCEMASHRLYLRIYGD